MKKIEIARYLAALLLLLIIIIFLYNLIKKEKKMKKEMKKDLFSSNELEKRLKKRSIDHLILISQIQAIENEEKGAEKREKLILKKQKEKLIEKTIQIEREIEAIEKVKKQF